MQQHKNLMVVGTSSGAGKSITVTGLCRIFYKDGLKTCPFKSQNMSLNSFITRDGKEMGRAQVVQAIACAVEPQSFMNPILLKPNSDTKSQVVLNGKSIGNMAWKEFTKFKLTLRDEIVDIYNKNIRDKYEVCVLEGAGSPVEINMTEMDMVNMGMAALVDAPAILVADIDKGGVFASIYGTAMLMPEEERKNLKGIIINKFRGDIKVLEPGLKKIEALLNIPILGVIPHFNIDIEDEDGFNSRMYRKVNEKENAIKVSVIKNDLVSNFNDFDPLSIYPDVRVKYVTSADELDGEDLIILPGSKNTIEDFVKMRKQGITDKIIESSKKGTAIVGICGGLQMLGEKIKDPHSIETELGEITSLGLLPIETIMEKDKKTVQYHGSTPKFDGMYEACSDLKVAGYEIHQGVSKYTDENLGKEDVTFVSQGNIFATYVHGIFDNKEFTDKVLNHIRKQKGMEQYENTLSFQDYRDIELDKLEKVMRDNLDMDKIYDILNKKI